MRQIPHLKCSGRQVKPGVLVVLPGWLHLSHWGCHLKKLLAHLSRSAARVSRTTLHLTKGVCHLTKLPHDCLLEQINRHWQDTFCQQSGQKDRFLPPKQGGRL
jgi:hypothetical protein